MASTIQIKRGTGSAVPTGLSDGELAINLDSGKLYFGSGSTSVDNFTFGELTAEKYIVSSSVLYVTTSYSSGSTEFGDTADDTHTFTGHITASGNISASGTIIGGALQISSTDTSEDTTHYVTFQKPGNNLTNITNGFTFNPSTDKLTLGGGTTFIEGSTGNINAGGRIHTTNITASGAISASGTITANAFVGNITGDLTGEAATVATIAGLAPNTATTQATQGAITSLGTLTGLNVNSHITASGNISASNEIQADTFVVNGVSSLDHAGSNAQLRLGYNTTHTKISLGRTATTTQVAIEGNITASGNISSSAEIYGKGFHVPISINDGYYIGAGKPILAINGQGGFLSIGAAHSTYNAAGVNIYTTGSDQNAGLFLDSVGNVTSSGNISSSTNIYAADYFDNGANINTIYSPIAGGSGIVTVGTIGTGEWNATVIPSAKLDADTAHLTTTQTFSGAKTFTLPITASSHISSSGTIYANSFNINRANALTYTTGTLNIGASGDWSRVNVGKSNSTIVQVFLAGQVTASGNISASGDIIGSNLSGTNTGDQSLVHLAVTGSDVVFGNITASGGATFGGGYGATGTTISTAGVGQFNGALTTDSSLTCTGTILINGHNNTTGARILFREGTDNGTNAIGFQSPAAVTTTTTFILPDGDGSNGQVLATNGGAVLSWATAGGDPSGAQTGITTIFNTGTKIGYADNGANIDFTTDDNIIFDIDGTQQIQLADGVLKPVTDSDVDLGTDALRFKDAYVDSVTSAGIVTAKTYDYISCGFFDNIQTSIHYLPLNGKPSEQPSEGNSYTDWVAPCHTTVLSIQVRFSSIISPGGDITMTVWKDPVGSTTKASVEAETVSVSDTNDNDVIHFLFDGAVIDKGETMKISIQATGGMTTANTFITVVLLQDWNDRYTASSQVFTS